MNSKTIEESFCGRFLSKFIGIKQETIEQLLSNDYDSIQALLAFDLIQDLDRLPNISMGQKSLLRKALIRLRQECDQLDNESSFNSTQNQLQLNSTPVIDSNISTGLVDTNYTFNNMIESALNNTFPSDTPLKAADRLEDNENQLKDNEKRVANISTYSLPFNELSDNSINNGFNDSKDKRKRKSKKFLFTSRRCSRTTSQKNSKPNRTIAIDIDLDVDQIDTNPLKNSQSTDELNNTSLITDVTQDTNEFEDENNGDSDILNKSGNAWKMKAKIKSLLQQKSNRIQLLELNETPELSWHFKKLVVDGFKTEFVYCNQCFGSLLYNKSSLRRHLKVCKAKNESKLVGGSMTEEELTNISGITSNSIKRISKIAETFDQEPPKRGSGKKVSLSTEELLKTVSQPTIIVKRIKVELNSSSSLDSNNTDNHESKETPDGRSETRKSINSTSIPKPYKCNFIGCQFSTSYPFSLDQHKIKHKRESVSEGMNNIVIQCVNQSQNSSNSQTRERQSLKSSCAKNISINQSESDSKVKLKTELKVKPKSELKVKPRSELKLKPKSELKIELKSNIKMKPKSEFKLKLKSKSESKVKLKSSKKEYQCSSNGCNFICSRKYTLKKHTKTIHNVSHSERVNIVNDHNHNPIPNPINNSNRYLCQSPHCKYGSDWKLVVKKHMLNIHNMDYKDIKSNRSIVSNSNCEQISSINEKIVNRVD